MYGNVGIGTTNPLSNLSVEGENSIISIKGTYPAAVNAVALTVYDVNNTDVFGIWQNGAIQSDVLGGTGTRAVYSDASGFLTNTASDIRLKKNIVTISDELDVLASLKRLRDVYYNWNIDLEAAKSRGSQRELGMIAQEVEAVMPELVGTNSDGYKSLDYAKMVGFLVEVAKKQQAEIDTLKGRITALEK